jgi:hypothetical protein
MGGCEVKLFGIDELIPGSCAEVFDVVDEEWVGGLVVCEEDDLRAAFSKVVGYCSANSSRAALVLFSGSIRGED